MWILSLLSFSSELQSFYYYFSGELSPALPPKRKSTVVSSPPDSATPPPPPYPTRNSGALPTNGAVNGAGVGDDSVPEPSVGEDNVPALPPKKSVSRMSTDLNELPVAEKPKVGTISSYKLCLYYLQWDFEVREVFKTTIERFHSPGYWPYWFTETKESTCIKIEFNSQRFSLGHQHGRYFLVLGHQHGRCDVM